MKIHPCVLQDIGPLGPLLKKGNPTDQPSDRPTDRHCGVWSRVARDKKELRKKMKKEKKTISDEAKRNNTNAIENSKEVVTMKTSLQDTSKGKDG